MGKISLIGGKSNTFIYNTLVTPFHTIDMNFSRQPGISVGLTHLNFLSRFKSSSHFHFVNPSLCQLLNLNNQVKLFCTQIEMDQFNIELKHLKTTTSWNQNRNTYYFFSNFSNNQDYWLSEQITPQVGQGQIEKVWMEIVNMKKVSLNL